MKAFIVYGIKEMVQSIKQPRKHLEKQVKKQPNDWSDKECQEATELNNKAYVNMQQQSYTRASTVKYQEAQRTEKQVHKRKKQQY